MNQPPTDQEFPTGDFSKGHLTAFEKIYALYYPGVLRFARELVQEPTVSATIVTDSFLKLWIQHADTGGPENITAFLHIGVQRSCFSYLKQVEQLTPAQLKKMSSYMEASAGQPVEKNAAAMKAVITGWFSL